MTDRDPPVVLLDVDGTLVDSTYHHALAWQAAFRAQGMTIPAWRLHRHVGMGGDQFVRAVAGDEAEERLGDELRRAHSEAFAPVLGDVPLLPGASAAIAALAAAGHRMVLASSAKEAEVEHYLDLLGTRALLHGWTTSADVEATKPDPEVIRAALDLAGGGDAIMVGDATWDCISAARAGIPTIAVLTGGFGADELRAAGAADVVTTLDELPDAVARLAGARGPDPERVLGQALARLQGESAADPGLAGDERRFAEVVDRIAAEMAGEAGSDDLRAHLLAHRDQLATAGS